MIQMKIVFMGTPDFAAESLKNLYEAGHEIALVVTNPDKPKGRGMKLIESPVKEYAHSKDLKIIQPEKIKNNDDFVKIIKEINPDVICVVAYGKILPKEIIDIPEKGCINVHGSLLPKYRGAAPIQWSIINGDKITGVTTMYMDVGMDTGDMILKQEVNIEDDETTGELWEKLSKIGARLLVETLEQIDKGIAPREKQGKDYSIAPMLDKKIAKIDWQKQTATEIKNLVRGLNPIMGAYTVLNGKKYKIWKANALNEDVNKFKNTETLENGTVFIADPKQGLYIKTKNGILEVIEIQGENSRKMSIQEFLRGNKIEKFSVFE